MHVGWEEMRTQVGATFVVTNYVLSTIMNLLFLMTPPQENWSQPVGIKSVHVTYVCKTVPCLLFLYQSWH